LQDKEKTIMSNNRPVPNPWDEGMNPPEPVSTVTGKVTIDASLVMFVDNPTNNKKMKVAFEPNTLLPDGSEPRPVSQIKVAITPSDPQKYEVLREYLVTSSEWTKITLPSIKSVGITQLPQLNGKWATAQMKGTGRKWTDKNGEEKEMTAIEFLTISDTEPGSNGKSAPAATQTPTPAPAAAQSNGNAQATALKFLAVYVNNAMRKAGGDIDKARTELTPMIASQQLLAKYFTVDSPEVLDLMASWKA
jgi:hypothetical protein